MISVLINVLRLLLRLSVWSILEEYQVQMRETVSFCSYWVECCRDVCELVSFTISISLLTFCLVVLSIVESVVLRSLTIIIVELPISPFDSGSFAFCMLGLCWMQMFLLVL